MDKRKKIIAGTAGAIAAAGLCVGGIFYVSRENPDLIDDILSGNVKSIFSGDDEEDEKKMDDEKIDADAAGKEKEDEEDADGDANGGQNKATQTNFVDNGGAHVSGTPASQGFSIKMSDLCTFSDPAGLSFDTRYVLHGGSGCTPARRASAAGYTCKEAYVILYAKGGKAAGEYQCFVMASEADARGLAAEYAAYYNGGGTSTGRWGDVVYIYSSGSYVQTSINTYADSGVISSATPEAYLAMSFYFGGMSEYHGSSGTGTTGSQGSSGSKPGTSGGQGSTDKPGTSGGQGSTDKPGTSGGQGSTDKPGESDKPSDPENPGGDEPEVPSSGISAAATKKEDCYPIRMSDTYLYEDPAELDFDTRYVIYAGEGSMAAAAMGGQAGTTVSRVYEIVYTKDGEGAAEYKLFVAADAAGAEAMVNVFGGQAVENIYIQYADADTLKLMIQYGALYAGLDETVEAYLQNMLDKEGYSIYQRTDSDIEEPGGGEPGGEEPEEPDFGTAQTDSFDIKVTDSFTYRDPEGLLYDKRYAVCGGTGCMIAMPYQADGVQEAYDIIYSKGDKVAGEYRVFVLETEEQAQNLRQKFIEQDMTEAEIQCEGNVLVQNCGTMVQDMIDMYYQFGMLSEATPKAYMNMLVNTPQEQGGMTECTKEAEQTKTFEQEDIKQAKAANVRFAQAADQNPPMQQQQAGTGSVQEPETGDFQVENAGSGEEKQEVTTAKTEPEAAGSEQPVQEEKVPETEENSTPDADTAAQSDTAAVQQ